MVSMTGYFFLDWAILTVSLFNTIVLLWLGLTILLNSDRRNPGVWLMAGGLLAGALFFISHTAILGQELTLNIDGHNFWWQVGWIPVIVAPFAWYVVMLWFNGFWTNQKSQLFRRHRISLVVMSTVMTCFIALIITAGTIPPYEKIVILDFSGALALGGIPILLLVFPVFMVLNILLSIDVLLHPVDIRDLTSTAQKRSRPWLLTAGILLLLVSVIVGIFIAFMINTSGDGPFATIQLLVIGLFDLVLATLIAGAIMMIGQAIVSYEVFTGRILPRRGLFVHWRNIILIALGYGAIISWSLIVNLRTVYTVGLATLMMVIFYALYSWRSFNEHDRFMKNLRPFVTPENIVSHFLQDSQQSHQRALTLLSAVCDGILMTNQVCLVPLGAYGSLISGSITYPENASELSAEDLPKISNQIMRFPESMSGDYEWGIPLVTERGLIGLFAVGHKTDNGHFSQEEFDLAQQAGERILDIMVGEMMAHKMMDIQRQRVRQNRIVDLQTQRELHDDILPQIHTAILELSSVAKDSEAVHSVVQTLTKTHQQIAKLIHKPGSMIDGYVRHDLIAEMKKIVAEFGSNVSASGSWTDNSSTFVDSLYCEVILGAVRELIRNASVHGRLADSNVPVKINIDVTTTDRSIRILIVDDGVGVENHTDVDGALLSGNGLYLHSTLLSLIGGELQVQPGKDQGTIAMIDIPASVLQI